MDRRSVAPGTPRLKIYTKSGDDGTTGLLGNRRTSKDDPRIDAYGTVDELNAAIGATRALLASGCPEVGAALARIQADLFSVGASLAAPDPENPFHDAVRADQVTWLEESIDAWESVLEPLTQFILPGGTPAAAQVHVARTVCRRAERLTVSLARQPGEQVRETVLVYLNRLSDALFVLARYINKAAGVSDIPWNGP
jgi:cob(I)alamin adenosyltransferase